MIKNYLLFCLITLLAACQTNENSDADATKETSEPNPTTKNAVMAETFCFKNVIGDDPTKQDVLEAQLTIEGAKVRGTYNWIPAEKDSARGTFLGVMNGGIITGIYNYTIEGARQKEEIIFKMTETGLMRKRGELIEENGILKLKNAEEAEFGEMMGRVDCEG